MSFDRHFLGGVAVALVMVAAVLGILAALMQVDAGLVVHGLAAIGFI
jgi:hypothetical protein